MNNKGLKHGDITQWAQKVMHDGLESIINAKSAMRTPYYIMVIVKDGYDGPAANGNSNELLHGTNTGKRASHKQTKTVDMSNKRVVTNRFVIMNKPPMVPMIGSSLWRIDNKTGEVRCMYILPHDKPMVGGFDVELDSKTVAKCSTGMPVIYTN